MDELDLQTQSAAGIFGTGRLNVHGMRPFFNSRGEPCIVTNSGGQIGSRLVTNALLRHDEWKAIDATVQKVKQERLVGIADLRAAGLVHNLGSIGVTISEWESESDMTAADVDMSGVTDSNEDTQEFKLNGVPVPVIHKGFRVNIRRLEASRRMGEGLDVTGAASAALQVMRASEDMLFAGNAIKVGGQSIYGYTTLPGRNTVAMGTDWTARTDNKTIVEDVRKMVQAARDAREFGNLTLYVPGAYASKLEEDYAAGYPKTVRARVLEMDGVAGIKIADRLATGQVVGVPLTASTVDLAIAQDVVPVQWQSKGGMVEHFKVMAVWVPRLKSDYDGRSGIVHLKL